MRNLLVRYAPIVAPHQDETIRCCIEKVLPRSMDEGVDEIPHKWHTLAHLPRPNGSVCSVYSMSLLLPFNVWRQRLRDDFARCDRLWGFNALGHECLRGLWQAAEPSVQVSSTTRTAGTRIGASRMARDRAGDGDGDGCDLNRTGPLYVERRRPNVEPWGRLVGPLK
jgi:hypothetical protein